MINYDSVKKKKKLDDSLLIKLIKGLEDIRKGKIKPWKPTKPA